MGMGQQKTKCKIMTEEQRYNIFCRDEFKCQVCGNHIVINGSPQIAHSIKSGKGSQNHIMSYLWEKYKKDRSRKWIDKYILDSDMNLSSVCSLKCNDAKNIFFKPVERDALIDRIISETGCLTNKFPDK